MPVIGNLDAANGSDIGKVEITDNSGVDILALDVQVGGVSAFHVRTKDASIANKPIIKNKALVVLENPDSNTAAVVAQGKEIAFGTIGTEILSQAGVGKLNGMPTLEMVASGVLTVAGFGSNNSAALPAYTNGEPRMLFFWPRGAPAGTIGFVSNTGGETHRAGIEESGGNWVVHIENGTGSDVDYDWAVMKVVL